MHDIPRKKWERECDDLQPRLHLFYREQKAQDKLDNLAKPFFLGIISSSSLLLHPSRAWNVAQPSSHFLQTIPTSWLFPGFYWFPPFPFPFLSVVLLSRSHPHPALRLVVWHPRSRSDRQHSPRGWRLPNGWNTGTYICSFGPSWERSRYLRNVKYLAT